MILQGKEPPAEYYAKPELDPALVPLYEAFYDLTTERQIGSVAGPIPRSKIKEYGREEMGLEGEALDRFIRTIMEIDGDYLSSSSVRAEEANKRPPAPKKKQPVPLGKRVKR